MADTPWHNDFLAREVQESQTSPENKNKTLSLLEEAAKICDRFGNSERADEIRKDCEDVRLATVWALLKERELTRNTLADFREELWNYNKDNSENLSDGTISDSEVAVIENEVQDLRDMSNNTEW